MPDHPILYDFLSGEVTLGFLVCALFFLRFWRRARDQLFVAFALAFTLLGVAYRRRSAGRSISCA